MKVIEAIRISKFAPDIHSERWMAQRILRKEAALMRAQNKIVRATDLEQRANLIK